MKGREEGLKEGKRGMGKGGKRGKLGVRDSVLVVGVWTPLQSTISCEM